jgi:hypothetical protein
MGFSLHYISRLAHSIIRDARIGYNAAMRLRRKQRPSYEQGELRDKEIEKLQDPNYQKNDLKNLLTKATKSRQKGSR